MGWRCLGFPCFIFNYVLMITGSVRVVLVRSRILANNTRALLKAASCATTDPPVISTLHSHNEYRDNGSYISGGKRVIRGSTVVPNNAYAAAIHAIPWEIIVECDRAAEISVFCLCVACATYPGAIRNNNAPFLTSSLTATFHKVL